MEKELKDTLKHVEENTKYLYPKDLSTETIAQNLVSKGISFMTKPTKQNTVDICTLALTIYLRTKDVK